MSEEPEDNVVSLRPKLDPLKQMSAEDWGRELYKSYLVSYLGLSSLTADHKASVASSAVMIAISMGTFALIEEVLKATDELEDEVANQRLKTNHKIKQIGTIIREELMRQSKNVQWTDLSDINLLQGGTPKRLGKDKDSVVDRFDFDQVAKKVIED